MVLLPVAFQGEKKKEKKTLGTSLSPESKTA